jgi:hypothetical protein
MARCHFDEWRNRPKRLHAPIQRLCLEIEEVIVEMFKEETRGEGNRATAGAKFEHHDLHNMVEPIHKPAGMLRRLIWYNQ